MAANAERSANPNTGLAVNDALWGMGVIVLCFLKGNAPRGSIR